MKHKLKSVRALAVTLITFGSLAGGANAAVTFVDAGAGDYRIASVTNINIGGTFYNATGVGSFESGQSLSFLSAQAPNTLQAADLLIGLQDIAAQVAVLNITLPVNNSDTWLLALTDLTGGSGGYDEAFIRISSTNPLIYAGTSFSGNFPGGVFSAQNRVFTFSAIPEPSSAILLGLGSLGLVTRRRRIK